MASLTGGQGRLRRLLARNILSSLLASGDETIPRNVSNSVGSDQSSPLTTGLSFALSPSLVSFLIVTNMRELEQILAYVPLENVDDAAGATGPPNHRRLMTAVETENLAESTSSGNREAQEPSKPPDSKKFSDAQRVVLEQHYLQNRYPSAQKRLEIATELGCTTDRIFNWFSHHRAANKGDQLWAPPPSSGLTFTPQQLDVLNREYNAQPDQSDGEKDDIALRLGISYGKVNAWFRLRRMKDGKKGGEGGKKAGRRSHRKKPTESKKNKKLNAQEQKSFVALPMHLRQRKKKSE